jgi:hypothetical protein
MSARAEHVAAEIRRQWNLAHEDGAAILENSFPVILGDLFTRFAFAVEIIMVERDQYLELFDESRRECARLREVGEEAARHVAWASRTLDQAVDQS